MNMALLQSGSAGITSVKLQILLKNHACMQNPRISPLYRGLNRKIFVPTAHKINAFPLYTGLKPQNFRACGASIQYHLLIRAEGANF